MSMDPRSLRQGRRLLAVHVAAALIAGIALGATAAGLIQFGIAAIVVVLFAVIASLETLRVLVLSNREPRR